MMYEKTKAIISLSYCALCEQHLTPETDSREHVIPKAIGGRKAVTGFICRSCNNNHGADWDAELTNQLNPLSLFLGISRQGGNVPAQILPTFSGDKVRLSADGTMNIAIPKISTAKDGESTRLEIHAPSRKELRQALKGMQRKCPKLKSMDLDNLMSQTRDKSFYSEDPIEISQSFGGPEAGRALVKSALSLVFDAGVDPRKCDLALDYLLNPSGNPCFGFYYDDERDLVTNRPSGVPLHCVSVKGCKKNERLLGYVEFYGIHRMVLCLSESYTGKDFTHLYAIDPISGKELDITVDLELSISDIQTTYQYEKIDDNSRLAAITDVFDVAYRRDFDRAMDRVIHKAVEYAFANCGASYGETLSEDQLKLLTSLILEQLEPFILHNRAFFGIGR